ncbi:hypothetical protein L6R52_33785 [Myxococcota bacterium]|nr:hypothetical protein [Myxococcota bacterium]
MYAPRLPRTSDPRPSTGAVSGLRAVHGLTAALAVTTLAALGALAGCSDEDPLSNVGTDAGVNLCPTGEPRPNVVRCASDSDCCSRESCFVSTGICFPRDACLVDADCPLPGQVCRDATGDGFNECIFERCDDTDPNACLGEIECPPDKIPACVGGGCICGEPCQGGCPSGEGCCIPTDTCETLPAECAGLTCPKGQFVSVTSTGAWDLGQCAIVGESCSCQRLPPLPLGDIGLHSALAHDGNLAVVSAYNLDYGDLMFGQVGPSGTIAWEFVDGLPATEDITGDIDGPRGGNSLPGDDVGLYTDVAIDPEGRPHVVYVDRTHGALKYAVLASSGWLVHTIDGEGAGDTGLYASLAIDDRGLPRVTYLSAREDGPSGRRSVLRLAFSATTTPSAQSSWELRDLLAVDLRNLGCEDRCNADEVCRASDQACVVPDPAPTTCGASCASGERCIGGACVAVEPPPAFRDLPYARGLFTSLAAMPDGGILVAFYDRIDENLKVARILGPNLRGAPVSLTELDGNGVLGSSDDAGLFPSLFVTPAGEIHLSYLNATRQALYYRNLDDTLATVIVEEVESGLGGSSGPDGTLVGADSALVVDRFGAVRIAYQDATNGDLRYARRMGPSSWTLLTLAGDEATYRGSFGFYVDQTLDGTRQSPIVSSYRYFLSAPGGAENGLETFSAP